MIRPNSDTYQKQQLLEQNGPPPNSVIAPFLSHLLEASACYPAWQLYKNPLQPNSSPHDSTQYPLDRLLSPTWPNHAPKINFLLTPTLRGTHPCPMNPPLPKLKPTEGNCLNAETPSLPTSKVKLRLMGIGEDSKEYKEVWGRALTSSGMASVWKLNVFLVSRISSEIVCMFNCVHQVKIQTSCCLVLYLHFQ